MIFWLVILKKINIDNAEVDISTKVSGEYFIVGAYYVTHLLVLYILPDSVSSDQLLGTSSDDMLGNVL